MNILKLVAFLSFTSL